MLNSAFVLQGQEQHSQQKRQLDQSIKSFVGVLLCVGTVG
jgi:hypothetical protein